MPPPQRIALCLWFDSQAEEAARFYVAIFRNSRITATTRYGKAGQEIHRRPPGSVMTVAFELDGQHFTALNGGPAGGFKFNEAISLQVNCESQLEIDYFWERLSEGGDKASQKCGWLKDRFGVSWQVVPIMLPQLLADPAKADKVMAALLKMKKLDISELRQAAER